MTMLLLSLGCASCEGRPTIESLRLWCDSARNLAVLSSIDTSASGLPDTCGSSKRLGNFPKISFEPDGSKKGNGLIAWGGTVTPSFHVDKYALSTALVIYQAFACIDTPSGCGMDMELFSNTQVVELLQSVSKIKYLLVLKGSGGKVTSDAHNTIKIRASLFDLAGKNCVVKFDFRTKRIGHKGISGECAEDERSDCYDQVQRLSQYAAQVNLKAALLHVLPNAQLRLTYPLQ